MPTRNLAEYVISPTGGIVIRNIQETDIRLGDNALSELNAKSPRRLANLDDIPNWGRVGVTTVGAHNFYTVWINRIPMNARFRLLEGVMVPQFNSSTDPLMTLVWDPRHLDLKLKMLIRITREGNADVVWLFAYDSQGKAWRLPLANVYEDCKLCTGQYDSYSDTHLGVVRKVLTQFEQGNWNKDLWDGVEQTHRFFRWAPKNDQFEVLPPSPDGTVWTTLCKKVAHQFMEYVI